MQPLIAALQDSNEPVREAVVQALGRFADARAVNTLRPMLRDPAASVRIAAAMNLKHLGWRPATPEELAVFEIALGHTKAAAWGSGESALMPLLAELKNDTSFQRRAAAEALEGVDDPRRIRPLLTAAQDPDPSVRVSAIYALANHPSAEIGRMLVNTFRDQEPLVRHAAADVLAKWEDPAYVRYFIELLADRHFDVRITAVQFLGKMRDPQAVEVLLPLLRDPDSDVRRASAVALGNLGDERAIEALVLVLIDEERTVRAAAENALEHIDDHWPCSKAAQQAAVRLEASLDDNCAWVRSAVRQVLAKLNIPEASDHATPYAGLPTIGFHGRRQA